MQNKFKPKGKKIISNGKKYVFLGSENSTSYPDASQDDLEKIYNLPNGHLHVTPPEGYKKENTETPKPINFEEKEKNKVEKVENSKKAQQ